MKKLLVVMLALLLAAVHCLCSFAVMSIKGGFDNKKAGEAYTTHGHTPAQFLI